MVSKKVLKSEYDNKQKIYEEFVVILSSLLENLLKAKGINYQTVQFRLKSWDSIERNINKKKYSNPRKLSEIKDLIGCRVIFYLEKDLILFRNLLYDEFKCDESTSKYSKDEYNATHFWGYLSDKRLELIEFEKFKGLEFEIQLTTVLFHGWNELEHDLIYKGDVLKENYPSKYEELKKVTREIMGEHLKKAQNSWEYVVEQYDLAIKGYPMFSDESLKLLVQEKNNNEIHKHLERFLEITKELRDFPRQKGPLKEILIALGKIIEISQKNEYQEGKTLFGAFKGKTEQDILILVLDILNYLKFQDLDATFKFLVDVYPNLDNECQQKTEEWGENLSEFNLSILRNQGYVVQSYLVKEISIWGKEKQKNLFKLICSLARGFLKTDLSDVTTSFENNSIVCHFEQASLLGDKPLKEIRESMVSVLISIYSELESPKERIQIIKTLDGATYDSHQGEKMRPLVIENAKAVLKFYLDQIDIEDSLQVLSEIEDKMIWLEKRFENELKHECGKVWNKLEKKEEYQFYRILVGYDRKFKMQEMDWEEASKYRDAKVDDYIGNIKESNEAKWIERIINIADTSESSEDIGKFRHFEVLLMRTGEQVPTFGFKLLKLNNPNLEKFKGYIIAGLWKARRDETKVLLQDWINRGRNLQTIAFSLRFFDFTDVHLIELLLQKVKKKKNKEQKRRILIELLYSIRFTNLDLKGVFLEVISELTKFDFSAWTNWFYEDKEGVSIFRELDGKEWDIILVNLISTNDIGYHDEYVLKIITAQFPEKLVDFFEKRVKKEEASKNLSVSYSSIPFNLHNLHSILIDQQNPIVDNVWKWFDRKYAWKAGILLHTFYPGFCSRLNEKIEEVIASKNKKSWKKYMIPIFQWYRGDLLEDIVKKTIISFPKDKKIWDACMIYLGNAGMVSGKSSEPIMANAYRRKKEKVEAWDLSDPKLKEFSEQYKKYLDEDIRREEKRHEEDMEKLKRKYS